MRKFRQQDMEQVLGIWLEASAQAHHFIPRKFWESKLPDMRESYIPSSETYVYEDGGAVKGFIALHENTIAAIFASPENWNKGIGTLLMAQAKALFADLRLTVYKENANSIRFYKKCGFSIVREQIDEHTGHPELLMAFP